jgi:hypothetical protein
MYIVRVCREAERVSADDERTPNDWRILMAEVNICLDGETWIPFPYPPDMSKEVRH